MNKPKIGLGKNYKDGKEILVISAQYFDVSNAVLEVDLSQKDFATKEGQVKVIEIHNETIGITLRIKIHE